MMDGREREAQRWAQLQPYHTNLVGCFYVHVS